MTTDPNRTDPISPAELAAGVWRLDPERSTVEFHVRHVYGLMIVRGRFTRYQGALALGAQPAIDLCIDATSLETGTSRRDAHLRSAEFFNVEHHPHVRFVSDSTWYADGTLRATGDLHAAGRRTPLEVHAALRAVDDELEIEAVGLADHRRLGMTWSPLGIMRAPSKIIVRGRLLPGSAGRGHAR
jgi:polyisoprenoid-binding protein YceI